MRTTKSQRMLVAPVSGRLVPLADLPDPAFAEGMLGDGIAIDPEGGNPVNTGNTGNTCSPCSPCSSGSHGDTGNTGDTCRFCSPCKGEVVGVADTAHAYNLLTDDGLELLLHIGIDTVELKGRGFSSKVKAGDTVETGDLLAEVDLAVLREGGYSTLTPLIVVNGEAVECLEKAQGRVECGKDAVLHYEIAKQK